MPVLYVYVYIYIWDLKLVSSVPAYVLGHDSARPSAGTEGLGHVCIFISMISNLLCRPGGEPPKIVANVITFEMGQL